MGLLGLGFGEIGRKFRRVVLRQQIKGAARAYSGQLRNLGKRAVEAGITGPADDSLKAGLADTESRDRDLGARLGALDEDIRKLEAQREADAQRFDSMRREVLAKKAPLDAHLAALQKAASSAPDKGAAANPEMDRLKAQIAPLKAELDRIEAERSQGAAKTAAQLADLRKRRQETQSESAAVSRERGLHFEKLGAVLAAAGIASPALANEIAAVAATAQAQAALQARHDASLAESRGMPKGTMAKFAALMLAAGAVLAAGGYAVNRAREPASPARRAAPAQVTESECGPMPSYRQKVKANPGGPYNVVRGRTARLDGSRSTGHCLKYTWTFSAAPADPNDKPAPQGGSADDQAVFAQVAKLACPEGQSGNPNARKTGQVAETTFLCSLKVTLTVSNSEDSDSKDVIVHVKPRNPEEWKTSIVDHQPETYLPGTKLVREQMELGKNLCDIDQSPAHALHAGAPWLGEGYEVASVTDAGGPFDGWWYIGASKLRIKRAIQLNEDLKPGLELHKLNTERRYPDFEVLRRGVAEHERLHGTIIFERMRDIQKQGYDPAKLIEPLSVAAAAQKSLVEWADIAIRQVESRLSPGQGSPEYIEIHREIKARLAKNPQYDRSGKILLRDGEYTIANIANAGEDAGR